MVLILLKILDSGAKVVIWDIDDKVLDKTKKDVNNVNLTSDIVDVSVYKDVEKAASKILSNSNIDILINNAGITGPTAPLKYDVATWNKIIELIYLELNCCRAIVPI